MPLGINGEERHLPSSGYRDRGTGALSGVGGGYLDFYVTGLHPSFALHRGYALPLRCLSE
ncbi:hypothetical protein [uncultured Rikenella sp.]|uniref:hypothetical protein n=1 Tax=uncultured Rikenella sp. TaxID=368003 RepID=UPI0026143E93|nr:hypothetical protein [uncultured Rikenella sp.]